MAPEALRHLCSVTPWWSWLIVQHSIYPVACLAASEEGVEPASGIDPLKVEAGFPTAIHALLGLVSRAAGSKPSGSAIRSML